MKSPQKITLLGSLSVISLLFLGSAFPIMNGVATSGYPTVFKLEFQNNTTGVRYDTKCTATQLAPGKFLTAAHCFCKMDPLHFGLFISSSSGLDYVTGATALIHPGSAGLCNETDDDPETEGHDLAVVSVPFMTARGNEINTQIHKSLLKLGFSKLAQASPLRGEPITIVGFGNSQYFIIDHEYQGAGSGVKRVGTNRILSVLPSGVFHVEGVLGSPVEQKYFGFVTNLLPANGLNSAGGAGDSGGPLFYRGDVAGVDATGGELPGRKVVSYSNYTDVNVPSNRQFIENALKIPNTVDLQAWNAR